MTPVVMRMAGCLRPAVRLEGTRQRNVTRTQLDRTAPARPRQRRQRPHRSMRVEFPPMVVARGSRRSMLAAENACEAAAGGVHTVGGVNAQEQTTIIPDQTEGTEATRESRREARGTSSAPEGQGGSRPRRRRTDGISCRGLNRVAAFQPEAP